MATILGYVNCEKQSDADKFFTKEWFNECSFIRIEKAVLILDDLTILELMKIKPSYWDKKKFWFEIPDKILKDYVRRKERHLQKIKNLLI